MPATTKGKAHALAELAERRKRGETEEKIDNSALVAGSPMYFDCRACGCQDIKVSEDYIRRPKLCEECQAMQDLGWLE